MITVHVLLAILAIICFGLAAAGVSSRVGLVPLGLCFLTACLLFV